MKIEVFAFLIVLAEVMLTFFFFPPSFINNSVDLGRFISAARFGKFK